MSTRIELIPEPGRARVKTTSDLLRPQVRSLQNAGARITLVATGATLLAGDSIDLEIVVGPGLTLDLADVAGTVVYDGRGQSCSWRTHISLATRATLIWHGEPLVVSSGADLHRDTEVEAADGARLLMRDTVALGRSGEDGGNLTCRTRMRLAGTPALAEDLTLSAAHRLWPGMLGDARVVDTVTALGWQPEDSPSETLRSFDLPCAGLMARALVPRAHLSGASSLWTSWRSALENTTA